jgi:hypothetical protein
MILFSLTKNRKLSTMMFLNLSSLSKCFPARSVQAGIDKWYLCKSNAILTKNNNIFTSLIPVGLKAQTGVATY